MTGIYQVYLRYRLFQGKRIYPGYTWYILSESAISRPGLYLVYTKFMPAHLKSCNPSCSISAIGMQRHTGFGLRQGCLMFITARGAPTGHPAARARRRLPVQGDTAFAFAARAAVRGDCPGWDGDSSSDGDGPGRWWRRRQGGSAGPA